MKKVMIDMQRKRLLEVSLLTEQVYEPSAEEALLRDAVRELSFVCAELLQDAEDRNRVENVEAPVVDRSLGGWDDAIMWLRAKPVGTRVVDRDGDPWCNTEKGWLSGQGDGEFSGKPQSERDIGHWAPFTVIDEPMPKIKVGDILRTTAQVNALPNGAVVVNGDDIALQRGAQGGLFYAATVRGYGSTTSEVSVDGYVTVVWLPQD